MNFIYKLYEMIEDLEDEAAKLKDDPAKADEYKAVLVKLNELKYGRK